jgi:hypothetical protein
LTSLKSNQGAQRLLRVSGRTINLAPYRLGVADVERCKDFTDPVGPPHRDAIGARRRNTGRVEPVNDCQRHDVLPVARFLVGLLAGAGLEDQLRLAAECGGQPLARRLRFRHSEYHPVAAFQISPARDSDCRRKMRPDCARADPRRREKGLETKSLIGATHLTQAAGNKPLNGDGRSVDTTEGDHAAALKVDPSRYFRPPRSPRPTPHARLTPSPGRQCSAGPVLRRRHATVEATARRALSRARFLLDAGDAVRGS